MRDNFVRSSIPNPLPVHASAVKVNLPSRVSLYVSVCACVRVGLSLCGKLMWVEQEISLSVALCMPSAKRIHEAVPTKSFHLLL